MHSSRLLPLAFLLLAAGLAPAAHAQPAADVPPPRLETLEEGAPAAAAVPGRADARPRREIVETRAKGGAVTEVMVNSGASSYVVKPRGATGAAPAGDGSMMRGAQWKILEFDWRRDRDAQRQAQQDGVSAAPATVPAPPASK